MAWFKSDIDKLSELLAADEAALATAKRDLSEAALAGAMSGDFDTAKPFADKVTELEHRVSMRRLAHEAALEKRRQAEHQDAIRAAERSEREMDTALRTVQKANGEVQRALVVLARKWADLVEASEIAGQKLPPRLNSNEMPAQQWLDPKLRRDEALIELHKLTRECGAASVPSERDAIDAGMIIGDNGELPIFGVTLEQQSEVIRHVMAEITAEVRSGRVAAYANVAATPHGSDDAPAGETYSARLQRLAASASV